MKSQSWMQDAEGHSTVLYCTVQYCTILYQTLPLIISPKSLLRPVLGRGNVSTSSRISFFENFRANNDKFFSPSMRLSGSS